MKISGGIIKPLKETQNSNFGESQKSSIKICLIKNIKKHCHKKSTCVFYNLGEENF